MTVITMGGHKMILIIHITIQMGPLTSQWCIGRNHYSCLNVDGVITRGTYLHKVLT